MVCRVAPRHYQVAEKKAICCVLPYPSSLQRTAKYASLLRISGALHLAFFEQPEEEGFFNQRPSTLATCH